MAIGRHLGTIWASVGLDVAPLGAGAARARRMMYALDASMGKSAVGMQRTVGQSMVMVGKAALMAGAVIGGVGMKMASDFDRASREVATLTGEMGESFERMKDQLLDLSTQTEHTATELMKGMYWIVSALPDASDAERMNVLTEAQKLATAGVADMADTADLATTAINAWGLSTDEAAHVNDVLFEIVKRGKTTISDLQSNFSKAASSSAQMNVPIEDLGAMIATLTRIGIPADRVLMALNRTLIGLNKPTEATAKWIKQVGYENAQAMVKAIGFQGVLQRLAQDFGEATGEADANTEALVEMFPNMRELLAILPLVGRNFGDVMKDFEEFSNVTGNVDEAYQTMSESMEFRTKELMNKIRKPLIEFGEALFPVVEGLGGLLSGFIGTLDKIPGGAKVAAGALTALAVAFVAVKVAALGSALISGISTLAWGIANIGFVASYAVSSIGSWVAALNPVTIAVAAAAVGIGGFIYALVDTNNMVKKNEKAIEKARKEMIEYDKGLFKTYNDLIPLASEYENLQKTIASGQIPEGYDNMADAEARVTELNKELASQFPEMVTGFDNEGRAIFSATESLKEHAIELARESGIELRFAGEGQLGQLEALNAEYDLAKKNVHLFQVAEERLKMAMDDAGISNYQRVLTVLNRDYEKGKQMLETLITSKIKDATISEDQRNNLLALRAEIENMDSAYAEAGGTLEELKQQMNETNLAIQELKKSMIDAAYQAGLAGDQLEGNIVQALKSGMPALQDWGINAVASWLKGKAVFAEMTEPEAQDLAVHLAEIFRTGGDWDGYGGEAGAALWNALIDEVGGPEAYAEIQKAARLLGLQAATSVIDGFSGGLSGLANLIVSAFSVSIPGIEVPIIPVVNPAFRTVKEAAQYMIKELQSVFDKVPTGIMVQIGPTTTTPMQDLVDASGLIDKATSSADEFAKVLNQGWLTAFQQIEAFDFQEVVNAVSGITSGNETAINSWLNLNQILKNTQTELSWTEDKLNAAKESIDKLNDSIDAESRVLRDLQDGLALYQKGLEEAQRIVQVWESVKIKGLVAADEKSFQAQQQLNNLQLGILKAEKARDFAKASALQTTYDELAAQKEIDDLQSQVTYEPQLHEIDKIKEAEKARQMGLSAEGDYYSVIVKNLQSAYQTQQSWSDLVDAQSLAIENQQLKIRGLQDELAIQNKYQQELYDKWSDLQSKVAEYISVVQQLGQEFVTQFGNMKRAMEDVEGKTEDVTRAIREAMVAALIGGLGGGIPSAQFGGKVLSSGLVYVHKGETITPPTAGADIRFAPLNISTSTSSTLHNNIYLDGRLVAQNTSRYLGKEASIHSRVGGRY